MKYFILLITFTAINSICFANDDKALQQLVDKEMAATKTASSCFDHLAPGNTRLNQIRKEKVAPLFTPYLSAQSEETTHQLISIIIALSDLNDEALGFFLDLFRGVKSEDGRFIHPPFDLNQIVDMLHLLLEKGLNSSMILEAYKVAKKDPVVFYENLKDETFSKDHLEHFNKKTVN